MSLHVLSTKYSMSVSVGDLEIFISGGPLTDVRGGQLQSRFSDSLYKQPIFFQKRGGTGPLLPPSPLNPPLVLNTKFIYVNICLEYKLQYVIAKYKTKLIYVNLCLKYIKYS